MDVQWAEAIACPTPLIFYSTLGGEASLKWLNYVLSQLKVPQTISASYISFEQDYAEGHNLQRLCANSSRSSVRVELALSSRAATVASTLETVTVPEASTPSPHSACEQIQIVHLVAML